MNKFFEEINFDTGRVCFGPLDTIKNLKEGAVETLIVWDSLELQVADLKPTASKDKDDIVQKYIEKKYLDYCSTWTDKQTNTEYQIIDYDPLLDWLSENYHEYKAEIFFVSDKSPEGNQFAKGFSGVGAILRYKVDQELVNDYVEEEDDGFI